MKKVFVSLSLLLAAVLCLSGCKKEYTEEQEKQVTEKGQELLQAWVSENMPGQEVEDCQAFIDYQPGPGRRLTDYVTGRVRPDGELTILTVNTVTGAVYLQNRGEELNEAAKAYLCEMAAITPESGTFDCSIMTPARDGGSKTETYHDYFDLGIPAGVEDLDAYVRDPGSRSKLEVNTNFSLPEDTDLFAYDLAGLKEFCEKCGVFFHELDITAGSQSFDSLWTRDTSTYQQGWIGEYGELRLWGTTRYRSEEEDQKTKEVKVSDQTFDPAKDLIFETTETGFRYSFPNKDWDHGFQIWTDKDSEIRQHEYLYLEDEEGQVGKDYEKRREENAKTMTWKDWDDGTCVMIEENHGVILRFSGSGEFRRKE